MKKIELYVRSAEQLQPSTYEAGITCEHTASGQVDLFRPQSTLEVHASRTLLENDNRAFEIVHEIAKERNWKVQVCDVSSFTGKLKARLKGISQTPVVVIDDRRIEGVPKREQLMSL